MIRSGRDPLLDEAWAELSDLEATPGGVALMVAMVRASRGQNDEVAALKWLERYLPISERLGLLEPTARGIMGRGVVLLNFGRPREGLVLLRGAHAFALANDLHDVEFNARVLMTFYEQWGEPVRGLELGREGFEIGTRRSSRVYGFGMVGNSVICALRVGEWDWAAGLLDEWLSIEVTSTGWAEFFVDRAILRALRGVDPATDIDEARPAAGHDHGSAVRVVRPLRACLGRAGHGRSRGGTHARSASVGDHRLLPAARYASRGAGRRCGPGTWGRPRRSSRGSKQPGSGVLPCRSIGSPRGPASPRSGATDPEALAGFRESLKAYRGLGLAFDEAAAAVDMATLLRAPEREAPDVVAAISAARETLTRIGARPFLAQLDKVPAVTGSPAAPGPRPSATITESV